MGSLHNDKLLRSFVSGIANEEFNSFNDLQDPTYLTFKLDFFPDLGLSTPNDFYSSGGLFRPSKSNSSISDYMFADSASDYLYRIGAPSRQLYLETFIADLYNLQERAPWFFQSVSGLGDFYKIDPANNFRGKDKILTIDCLESIDLRMSKLADSYRNLAFDMQYYREILPINLRTFNMHIHVLEFRKFNTTYGIIADHFDKNRRPTVGQRRQILEDAANRTNVFNDQRSSLFTGTFDNLNRLKNIVDTRTGGVFTNKGVYDNDPVGGDRAYNIGGLASAFEAVSVQTFVLKDCEFDFFSEAPPYLDTMSVKDIPEATHRFKIKVGQIYKSSGYSFYNYVISEFAKYSKVDSRNMPTATGLGRSSSFNISDPYFDETDYDWIANPKEYYRAARLAIFPNEGSETTDTSDSYNRALEESNNLKRRPLEQLIARTITNAEKWGNKVLNTTAGNITQGVIGTEPLGNVYGNQSFIRKATNILNGLLPNPFI